MKETTENKRSRDKKQAKNIVEIIDLKKRYSLLKEADERKDGIRLPRSESCL